MYTGEPDIPAAMPLVASMTGPDSRTSTKSWPGRITSGSTARISTSKETGVVPCTTVQAVPVMPGCMSAVGRTSGMSAGVHVPTAVAGPAASVVAITSNEVTATSEKGRRSEPIDRRPI